MKEKYIYALVDPRDSRIRYIGCSVNPERRYLDHMHRGKNETPRVLAWRGKYIPVCEWIYNLVQQNEEPLLVIIEKCKPGSNYFAREDYWLQRLDEAGADLTNVKMINNTYTNRRHIAIE